MCGQNTTIAVYSMALVNLSLKQKTHARYVHEKSVENPEEVSHYLSFLQHIGRHHSSHQDSRGEDIESIVQTIPSFLLVIQTKQQQRWMVEYGNT